MAVLRNRRMSFIVKLVNVTIKTFDETKGVRYRSAKAPLNPCHDIY